MSAEATELKAECSSSSTKPAHVLPINSSQWQSLLCDLHDEVQQAVNHAKHKRRLPTYIEQASRISKRQRRTIEDGHRRYLKITKVLDNFNAWTPGGEQKLIVRSKDQKIFHEAFLHACIPIIYGDEWEKDRVAILRYHGISKISQEVMCMTPRRWGKTWSVAMFVAAMAVTVPGLRILIFSTGGRASGSLMELIVKFIGYAGYERHICKVGVERVSIARGERPPGVTVRSAAAKDMTQLASTAHIFSFPASVSSLRGCTGRLILVEEAAFLKEEMFKQVIVPLLGVVGTVMLMISTPDDEYGYYVELMNTKNEHGEPMFKTIRIGLSCDACVKTGTMAQCVHVVRNFPPWKTAGLLAKQSPIMARDSKTNARENYGVLASDRQFVFGKNYIQTWFTGLRVRLFDPVDTVFMAVDPAGGSDVSDYTIATMVYVRGLDIIVGLDRSDSRQPEEITGMILNHSAMLLENPLFIDASLVLIVEGNMSRIDANRVASAAKHVWCSTNTNRRISVMSQSDNNYTRGKATNRKSQRQTGVWTGPDEKMLMVARMQQSLRTTNLRVWNNAVGHDLSSDLETLRTQMQHYRKIIKATPEGNAWAMPRLGFTGKSAGKKDDLVIVVQLNLYWSNVFMRKMRDDA